MGSDPDVLLRVTGVEGDALAVSLIDFEPKHVGIDCELTRGGRVDAVKPVQRRFRRIIQILHQLRVAFR